MADDTTFKDLAHSTPALLWWADVQLNGCDFSRAWLEFTGSELEEQLGTGWLKFIHPGDLRTFRVTFDASVKSGQPFEHELCLCRADANHVRVRLRANPVESSDGKLQGFAGDCVYVAQSVQPPVERDFFEMSFDNLCIAGFDGYFKKVNPSWTRTLGWTREELMSRPIQEFAHPDDRERILSDRQQLKEGRRPEAPMENRYLHKDGTYRWFEWKSVSAPENQLIYGAARDVTDRKHNEAELEKAKHRQETLQRQLIVADRMASVGTLALGVAHEINNPLSYVNSNISFMLSELEKLNSESPGPRLDLLIELAAEAIEGGERIRRIVRGLSTFSRQDDIRVQQVDLHHVLETSIDMTINQIRHRARLVTRFQRPPLVEADEGLLSQVFVNILINAAQAISENDGPGNEVVISTRTGSSGSAIVEIKDTGHGIPDAIRDRIFDPFFTTKPVGTGTGLGLSLCHNIITGFGGQIDISSVADEGTTVRVTLPSSSESSAVLAGHDAPDGSPLDRVSVLVIDDEPAIGAIMRRIMRSHDVSLVESARSALDLLDHGQHFDVIFSDIMMPEMSGIEFYKELSDRFPELASRVVFVTGGAFTAEAQKFLQENDNPLLEKPFTANDVERLLQRVIAV